MTDYANHAIIDIRAYLLDQIYDSQILYAADYEFDPVVPIQQLPETNLTTGDKPFVVYEFVPEATVGTQYWILRESAVFYVYSNDYLKVLELQNLIVDLFRREELSARDLNVFNDGSNIQFLHVNVESSEQPSPAASEAGRISGAVTIEYSYTRAINKDGRFAL